ncbi:MAG: 1-acyl-sn-glycerol-3-phosphate acyltransferase [Candidatus Desulfatibia sp.]|uniref:1-acyl-sn-glycerol-3-phosphate acyltransferase n=1 Tax=Candidatus Desulfatibia sp. TaxID=3101189 RepID=UPI002F2F112F
MTGQITISIWFFLFLVIISALAVLDRIFIPSVRWFLRRRINRVIDEIGSRLDIEIKPFQLTKRQVLVERLVYDPKVIAAIQTYAQKEATPREVVQAKVLRYAKEIVPSFNAYLYFRLGYWLAKKIARRLYMVHVVLTDDAQLNAVYPDATVVFVMNHRSNMDYILVAFLAAERTTLSYAVGEWAKIWPLQTLIKAMGAYFVRRRSRDPLYRLVLERYVHMATKEGVCQAVFLEGRLSRDGRLQPPKLGLIDYMLRSFELEKDRDIIFIPVGINYDRTLEDRSLVRALDPEAEKRSLWFVVKTTSWFIWRSIVLMISSRWQRYGYACVNFGPHVSARQFCRQNRVNLSEVDRETRFGYVEKLCKQLMNSIEQVIPILPVSLVSMVMLESVEQPLSAFEVEAHVHDLIDVLEARGATVHVSGRSRAQNILTALNTLRLRRIVIESEGLYRADPKHIDVLTYYANAIVYWRQIPNPN